METQEDRLRRMKRERESIASASWEPNPVAPKPPSTASATWTLNPTAPRDTGIAQGGWDEKPKPTSTAQGSWGPPESSTTSVTWSDITPEGLAAEITKPKPTFARTNKDGSPDYSVPKYGLPSSHVDDIDLTSRVRGGVDYVLGGDSIRNQLAYLDEVKSGARGVDAPTSHHGLERTAPQVAAAEAPSEPYDWSRHSVGVRTSPEYAEAVRDRASKEAVAAADDKPSVAATPASLQQPESPQPEVAAERPTRPVPPGLSAIFRDSPSQPPLAGGQAADRPAMVTLDPKAAVQAEPVPMPSKITPAQRKMEARAKERSMQKNASMQPHLAQAARDMGIEGVPFEELTGDQITDLRYKAGKLQRSASQGQLNDRQSDRNQSREQNVPMALATAQRLQGRGRALLAQAGGLDDADPRKSALQAQGEQMLAQGNSQQATFMHAWERQSEQQIQQNVVRTAMIFGKAGAGIVEGHLRGQQEMARARLNDRGQRDDRKAAEEGLNARNRENNDVQLAVAGMNLDAQQLRDHQVNEQRIAELEARAKERELNAKDQLELEKRREKAAEVRLKMQIAADRARDAERGKLNPPPMQPAEQRAQLWEPLKAADTNPDDPTPVQQYVDDFMQTLASQEGLQPQQRQIQGGQVKAWANQHVMSRWENDRLRDSDRGYIRSLVYATDADGNNTGKLKDRSTFVREMGSHYKGSNWASMAAKLGAFYDRLQKEEQESANLTQIGIPDDPVV